jgi:hypothetical protein
MNKKVIICGDSFMTPARGIYKNTHFTEILSIQNNWNVEYYSKCAMSNAGICIQIEDAIRQNPDLVLLGTSYFDRVEIAIDTEYDADKNDWQISDIFDPMLTNQENKSLIISTIGVLVGDLSSSNFPEGYKKIPGIEEKLNTLRQYVSHMYSPNFKRKLDRWCLESAIMKLYLHQIPFCIVIDRADVKCPWDLTSNWGLENSKYYAGCFEKEHHVAWLHELWADRPYDWESEEYRIWASKVDPGYHTLPKHQEILADFVQEHLKKYF